MLSEMTKPLSHLLAALFVVLTLVFASFPAGAKNYALLIGNSGYSIGLLDNPSNDARDLARVLKNIGFETIVRLNSDAESMKATFRDFGAKLANNDGIGLFFFARHGVQANGENYLLPQQPLHQNPLAEIARTRTDGDVRWLGSERFLYETPDGQYQGSRSVGRVSLQAYSPPPPPPRGSRDRIGKGDRSQAVVPRGKQLERVRHVFCRSAVRRERQDRCRCSGVGLLEQYREQYQPYLDLYPEGKFASLSRNRLAATASVFPSMRRKCRQGSRISVDFLLRSDSQQAYPATA